MSLPRSIQDETRLVAGGLLVASNGMMPTDPYGWGALARRLESGQALVVPRGEWMPQRLRDAYEKFAEAAIYIGTRWAPAAALIMQENEEAGERYLRHAPRGHALAGAVADQAMGDNLHIRQFMGAFASALKELEAAKKEAGL